MFRVVTLEEVPAEQTDRVRRALHVAFGVGCEHVGTQRIPAEAGSGPALDAVRLLAAAQAVQTFADDKIVYLTDRPLLPRDLPTGKVPTFGLAQFGKERAVVTSAGMGSGDGLLRRLGKHAVHEAGHLWELHHCLDPRCAMHPPWSGPFAAGDAVLCPFCRDKSEKKIRTG